MEEKEGGAEEEEGRIKSRGGGGVLLQSNNEVRQTLGFRSGVHNRKHQQLRIHDMATKIIFFTVNGRPEQAEFPVDCPAQDVKGRNYLYLKCSYLY